MKGGLFGSRQEWADPQSGQKDGTYFGSQLGNSIRSAFQVGTGLGGAQAVLFDYELRKFKVNVNPGGGKLNFQIIGKDAAELSQNLDYKWGIISTTNIGNSVLGSIGKGISRGITAARGYVPEVKVQYSPVPQKPAAPVTPIGQKKGWFKGGKTARKGRRAARGTRRN